MLFVLVRMVLREILSAIALRNHQVCYPPVLSHWMVLIRFVFIVAPVIVESDPCNPSPCGSNAECNNGICTCIAEYHGDPYRGCRPECITSSDCPRDKTCSRNKCIDPCPGTCGQNAVCNVHEHVPMCSCLQGYSGNAFVLCSQIQGSYRRKVHVSQSNKNNVSAPIIQNPCSPSPCGPNSQCRVINQQAVCSCLPNYMGSPPTCRPECITSSECLLTQACVNQKCIDPCPGTCGFNALCQVVNHNPICSCPVQQTGDPFTRCIPFRKFLRLLSYSETRFIFFRTSWGRSWKPMPTIPLRTKCAMQGSKREPFMFLLATVHR